MANTVKHKTLPTGTDRPGFAGITPSLYAEEHAFSGGAHGSVLTRSTGTTDGGAWVATAAGLLLSTGVATAPSFTASIPFSITTQAIAAASNNLYDIGASATKFKDGYFAGTLTAGTFSGSGASLTSIPAANLTGTIASAVQDAITRTGTVTSGTWSASFGAVSGANLTNLTAANVTGSHTLPDGVLSTNVPLLNAANAFTAGPQTIAAATANNVLAFKPSGTQKALVGMSGAIKGTAATDLGLFAELGQGLSVMVNGSTTDALTLSSTGALVNAGTLAWGGGAAIASSSNVALLNAANAFTGASQSFAVGGTSSILLDATSNYNVVSLINATSVTANVGLAGGASGDAASLYHLANTGGSHVFRIGSSDLMTLASTGALSVTSTVTGSALIPSRSSVPTNGLYLPNANALGWATNSTLRWGINASGDWTYGASSHIADSVGTPTISSGFGTSPSIAGTDYAIKLTLGTGSPANGTITFGHTFSNVPVVIAISESAERILITNVTTTSLQLAAHPADVNWTASSKFNILVRGY